LDRRPRHDLGCDTVMQS